MATTMVGYNRDPCDPGVATKIDSLGVDAVTTDDDIICIPPGWGLTMIQLRLSGTTLLAGTATELELVLDDGTTETVILSAAKTDLNSGVSASLVGTDASPISIAKSVEQGLKLRANSADFGPAGPTVCVLFKMKPLPSL